MKNTITIDGVRYAKVQENSERVEKLIKQYEELIKLTGSDNDSVMVHPEDWRYDEFDLSQWNVGESAYGGTSMRFNKNSNLTVFLNQKYSEIEN